MRSGLGLALALLLAECGRALRIPWWPLISNTLVQLRKLEQIQVHVDFSAGASTLSSPEMLVSEPVAIVTMVNSTSPLRETPLLLAHQMGKRMVRKLPDSALLGFLVLIASELLQREVNTKFLRLPPLVRELVNSTAVELDSKLEFLSSLQWEVDPFLRAEIENLQNQPLEIIDKFVVTEILPRVDRELSPVLSNLIGDPRRVSQITKNIKELIQSASVVLLTPGPDVDAPRGGGEKSITQSVMKSVDLVGDAVEEAIRDWNSIILDLSNVVRAESILQLIPESLSANRSGSSASSASYWQWSSSKRSSASLLASKRKRINEDSSLDAEFTETSEHELPAIAATAPHDVATTSVVSQPRPSLFSSLFPSSLLDLGSKRPKAGTWTKKDN
jgi:hypothetical protein